MGRYLITGRQGSGKSSVIRRLQELGFTAYNTDDMPEITRLEDRQTGQMVAWPEGLVDWNKCSWNWQAEPLKRLLDSDKTVFIGAVTGNQQAFYPLFDKIFALTITAGTLRTHLQAHEHQYAPEDIERIVARHAARQPRFVADGAIPIDNNGDLEIAVQNILSQTDDR